MLASVDTGEMEKAWMNWPVSPFCLRQPWVSFIGLKQIKPCYQYLVVLGEWAFNIYNLLSAGASLPPEGGLPGKPAKPNCLQGEAKV